MLNSPASGMTQTLLLKTVHWALPRLAVYALAAVGSMALFAAGVTLYAYIWPVAPLQEVPHTPQVPELRPDPARLEPGDATPPTPPILLPTPGRGGDGPVYQVKGTPSDLSKYSDKQLIGMKLILGGTEVGQVVKVYRDAQGTVSSLGYVEMEAYLQFLWAILGDAGDTVHVVRIHPVDK